MKTATAGIAHKSDRDGVRLWIANEGELRDAYGDIETRLGPRVTVAAMVPHEDNIVEMHLGVLVDDQFGPLVIVAAGGVLVEAFDDRLVALPPLGVDSALALLRRLRVSRVLGGIRGGPPVDRSAIAAALSGLSQLAAELGDALEAVDINPLIAGPKGCIAVDALVLAHPSA